MALKYSGLESIPEYAQAKQYSTSLQNQIYRQAMEMGLGMLGVPGMTVVKPTAGFGYRDLSRSVNNAPEHGRASSFENKKAKFSPGFLDTKTGEIFQSAYADGSPAGIHLFDGLPKKLWEQINEYGEPMSIKTHVEPGFILDGKFFSRKKAHDYIKSGL